MQRSVVRIIITILLSAVLLLTLQKTPVNKQVLQRVSVLKTTVVPKVPTARKVVQPQPVTEAVVIPQPVAQGCNAYITLIDQYHWDTRIAAAVMRAESGCNPNAIGYNTNGTADRGLFQVNSIHADMVDGDLGSLYSPATNVATAYRIYSGGGWERWTTYTSGKYLRYL